MGNCWKRDVEDKHMRLCCLFQDWDVNRHDMRIRWMLVAFRLAQRVRHMNRFARCLWTPYLMLYHVVMYWVFHVELNENLEVGEGLRIFHGYCLVIHPNVKMGRNVMLRHCTTLGNKGSGGGPVLCDGVEVGAHAAIIGSITIGANAIIGAGAVVTKDVPAGAVVVGNPARILRIRTGIL